MCREGIDSVPISKDDVFDGTAGNPYEGEDTTSQVQEYGEPKMAGEQAAQDSMKEELILRPSFV